VKSEWKWLASARAPLHFEGYRKAGEWIKAHSGPADGIAFVEIGTLAYFSDRPVEDLLGLVTLRSLPFVAEQDIAGAFLAKPTEFVIVRPRLDGFMGAITTTAWFGQAYEERIRFDEGTTDWTAVYRRTEGATIPPARPPQPREIASGGP
jgi:hypothetical protein